MTTDDTSSAPAWPPPPPAGWAEGEPAHHPQGAPAALALLASIGVLVYGLFFSAVDPVEAAIDYDPVPPLSLLLHLSFAFYAAPFAVCGAFALVPGAVQPWVTAGVPGYHVVTTSASMSGIVSPGPTTMSCASFRVSTSG